MAENNEDGWVEIVPTSPTARSHVTLCLITRKAGDRLSMMLPVDLWPVLANHPTRFTAWRKGDLVRISPSEDGPFKGGWRGQNKATFGIMIDAWDGLAAAPSGKYMARPDIVEGDLFISLPADLFKTGTPRASKSAAPASPISNFDPPKKAVVTAKPPSSKDRLTAAMRQD